jgi:hypothetical protein
VGHNLLPEVDCEKAGLPKLNPKDYISAAFLFGSKKVRGVRFFKKL